jgi:hypothetical protein
VKEFRDMMNMFVVDTENVKGGIHIRQDLHEGMTMTMTTGMTMDQVITDTDME